MSPVRKRLPGVIVGGLRIAGRYSAQKSETQTIERSTAQLASELISV